MIPESPSTFERRMKSAQVRKHKSGRFSPGGGTLVRLLCSLLMVLSLSFSVATPAAAVGPVKGSSQHWTISDDFIPADPRPQGPEGGLEFMPEITYRGPEQRIRWFWFEAVFPDQVTVRSSPLMKPGKRDICVWYRKFHVPGGAQIKPGSSFRFGRCEVYPWKGGLDELLQLISKMVYVVVWEDDAGVHSEAIKVKPVE